MFNKMFCLALMLVVWTSCGNSNATENQTDPMGASTRVSTDSLEEEPAQKTPLFKNSEGKFLIAFPGKPKMSKDKTQTEIGAIDITMFLFEQDPTMAYLVGYSDYPEDIIRHGDANEMLKDVQRTLLEEIRATETDSKKIMLKETYLGKAFQAKSEKFYVVYELYLVGRRLYQIGAISTLPLNEEPRATEIKQYFQSFQLLDEQEPAQ